MVEQSRKHWRRNREDLTPFDIINLERKRLRWVEHHTISAAFRDGSTARLSYSTYGRTYIAQVHQELMAAFIKYGNSYRPPSRGVAKNDLLIRVSVNKPEKNEIDNSRWDIPKKEAKFEIYANRELEAVRWLEPVKTVSLFGKASYHLVQKMLCVHDIPNTHTRALVLSTWRKDGRVAEAHFALNILEAVDMVGIERAAVYKNYDPVGRMAVGTAVVARGRFGYFMPLTCTCASFEDIADVGMWCEHIFLPLVGSAPRPHAAKAAQQIKPDAPSRRSRQALLALTRQQRR